MDWSAIPSRAIGQVAQQVVDHLNASGVVKEAYYRIHADDVKNESWPIIYAQLATPPLDGVPITIRDEAIAKIAEQLETGNA